MTPERLVACEALLGLALVTTGVAQFNLGAALITAGVGILAFAVLPLGRKG